MATDGSDAKMSLVVFRVDSSKILGSGHIQRCITLANYLKAHRISSVFISKDFEGNFGYLLEKAAFPIHFIDHHLNEKEDSEATLELIKKWSISTLVIDCYALSSTFEHPIKKAGFKILVIDDLMNRPHECDLLLDQNYRNDYTKAYDQLLPSDTLKFLGPTYSLLRPQFFEAKPKAQLKIKKIKNIFVFFGGSDSTKETLRFLNSVLMDSLHHYHVLLSKGNVALKEILAIKNGGNFTLHVDAENVADIMLRCDFYIGSGGTITWERMILNLSGLVISVADNQIPGAEALAKDGLHSYLGPAENVDYKKLPKMLLDLEKNSLKDINEQILKYQRIFSTNGMESLKKAIIHK